MKTFEAILLIIGYAVAIAGGLALLTLLVMMIRIAWVMLFSEEDEP